MILASTIIAAGALAASDDEPTRTWAGWATGFVGVLAVLALVTLATWLLRRRRG